MLLKSLKILLLLCISFGVNAQFTDNFTDGDFTNNPTWVGDTANYEVDISNQLHLNAPAITDTSYLSTNSGAINNTTWEFYVELDFNPSSSNYAQVFLTSDQSDLKSALNGYFVKIGNTSDEISLYRQDGFTETEIIDGQDGRVAMSPVTVRVQVIRDLLGNWQLNADTLGGTNFVTEGNVLDATHSTSSFFGVYSRYTSTRSDKFYYDDFSVIAGPIIDTTAPQLNNLTVLSATTIDLQFNEPVDLTTSQITVNYSIDNGIGNPSVATRDGLDSSLVHLTLGTPLTNGQSYNLTINAVEDTAGNAINNHVEPFSYFIIVTPNPGDVIINEIFADPTPVVGLPGEEYVELFNHTSNIFNLGSWEFVNSGTAKILPSFNLQANAYVILCDVNDTALFTPYGDVIGITSFTALSDTGT